MGNVGQHYYGWHYAATSLVKLKNYPGKLVYVDPNKQIFTINSDGTNRTKIAEGSTPLFSPDGKQVAFINRKPLSGAEFGDQLNYF